MFPDYKSTVRLPQTDFPMKGNLPQREPQFLERWDKMGLYHKMLAKNKAQKPFVFLDGPPYANNSIHIGHALNKILKDVVIKYRSMSGAFAPFVPGFDCHGLPIEHAVMKDLGDKAKEKSPEEIIELCRAEASKWIKVQTQQFKRLGVIADWENPYVTMSPEYEAAEVRAFARAYQSGAVYWGVKPVYWNWLIQTALAEAEVEYHPRKSPSITVRFPVTDAKTLSKLPATKKPVSVAIWTTTPWTLPANQAVCFHPDFTYCLFETETEAIILAKDLAAAFMTDTGLQLNSVGEFLGKTLEGGHAQHPFLNRSSLMILGEHVTLEAGTGVVHTAPGHGADDYRVGLKYKLEVLSPVGPDGTFTKDVPDYAGVHIFKANPLIVEKLQKLGLLLAHKEIEHSYPHCWRTKAPLIYRATAQWFIGLDQPTTRIREKTLAALKEIRFFPGWGEARLKAMMENRPDWCLSRQRIWGVPIPIFYCKKTGLPLADLEIMKGVADVIEKEGGITALRKHPPEYYIGDRKVSHPDHPEFGKDGFRHSQDILDVWFDSGIAHTAVQTDRMNLPLPADIYLEGSDQHRGWFNTSLLSSLVINNKAPFRALITHGFVNDAQGFKMSKSRGNKVDPEEIYNKSGAEILRLWCIYEDYGQDLSCGPEILDRVTETYRRIRNTLRFLLGATNDFDPQTQGIKYEKMLAVDRWALTRLNHLIEECQTAYDQFAFYKVYHALNTFFTVDLSATYLDLIKDRLYTWKADGHERRSAQTALTIILDHLTRLMAPVLSFLAEEVFLSMKNTSAESVFLMDFPVPNTQWNDPALAEEFEGLLKVRQVAQKSLETLREQKMIGSSLEAKIDITCDGAAKASLEKLSLRERREFFIVSDLSVREGPLEVTAQKADGEKCVRCWTYSVDTNKNSQFPGICGKCVEALT